MERLGYLPPEGDKNAAPDGAAESMSYSPGSLGTPGHLIMDPEASYSAWLHELRHLADDEASGWQGMSILIIPEKSLAFEEAAYRVEIDFARKHG